MTAKELAVYFTKVRPLFQSLAVPQQLLLHPSHCLSRTGISLSTPRGSWFAQFTPAHCRFMKHIALAELLMRDASSSCSKSRSC